MHDLGELVGQMPAHVVNAREEAKRAVEADAASKAMIRAAGRLGAPRAELDEVLRMLRPDRRPAGAQVAS